MTRLVCVGSWLIGAVAHAQTSCPAEQNQGFAFSGKTVQTLKVEISKNADGSFSFPWPHLVGKPDSALLMLKVRSNDAQPLLVRLSSGDTTSEQMFPAGGAGTRTLNASSFANLNSGAVVAVQVSHGAIDFFEATLSLFKTELPTNGTTLVLAPHPDDAEVGAFGLYASRKSTVVTLTAGNAGEQNYCQLVPDPASHYRFKGEVRVIDSVTIPWQGGVPASRAFNLGYFDGQLQTMFETPGTAVEELYVHNDDTLPYRKLNQAALLPLVSRKATWNNLVADLKTILNRVRPTTIVIPDPRLDSHPDHQLTTVALSEALAKTKLTPTILLYTNHADHDRYPLGPTGQDFPLTSWCGTEPLPALGFYAFAMNAEQQRRKLMALESMHDLRLAPSAQYDFGTPPDDRCQSKPGAPLGESTYFRRAVRSHEWFLVVDRTSLLKLVADFIH